MIPALRISQSIVNYRKLAIEEMEIDDSPLNLGNLLTDYDTGFKLIESLSPPTELYTY